VSEPILEITDPHRDRYAALRLIPWWDQGRLRRARVMVVGAGALGNEVLKNLALLGVGRVFLVDFDRVEASNLSRSVLFRAADAGRPKAEAAAGRLREINPEVRVAAFHGDVARDLGLGAYRQVDVVLGCLDNRAARLAVNAACWRVGVPWIDGALDVLMGTVRVFVPPDSACYECTMTAQDYALLAERYSCPLTRPGAAAEGRLPTTPTSASFTAALQVQEAVKLLHGLPVPAGRGIYFNGQALRLSVITYPRREDCYAHETYGPIRELAAGVGGLTVGSFLSLASRAAGAEAALLLDHDLVLALFCPRCRAAEAVYRPFAEAVPALAACPTCGADRTPHVTTRLTAATPRPEVPLRQVGIPPWHVVRVEAGGQPWFFELAGDKPQALEAWGA
jgi:adenylyltransferase/sulfurtransferase